MSVGVQSAAAAGFIPTAPLGYLNLSSAQEAQIEQVLGELQGGLLTPGQAQARIGAIVNPPQAQASKAVSPFPSGSAATPFPTLHLTSKQKGQIESIFQSAQANGTSAGDVRSQVDGVLTPSQRQQLKFLSSYSDRGAATGATPSYVLFANA